MTRFSPSLRPVLKLRNGSAVAVVDAVILCRDDSSFTFVVGPPGKPIGNDIAAAPVSSAVAVQVRCELSICQQIGTVKLFHAFAPLASAAGLAGAIESVATGVVSMMGSSVTDPVDPPQATAMELGTPPASWVKGL